jgi:hypothetical protein
MKPKLMAIKGTCDGEHDNDVIYNNDEEDDVM